MKIRLHIPEALPGVSLASFFVPLSEDMLFRSIGQTVFFEQDVERVEISSAQAILLPNNFTRPDPAIEPYIRRYADLAEEYRIPIFIFSFGDFTDQLHFDSRVRVFRLSVYRGSLQPQDIVVPTFAEDHGSERVVLVPKRATPVVSFCGMGGFQSWERWVKYLIKVFLRDIQSVIDPHAPAKKIGIYWRRAMMRACSTSKLVVTNFIVRRSFSSIRRTIEGNPETMRREFIESIINADFVLTPKGDGNYSNRFMETISLGRIPVLVDTEVVFPLEDEIHYADFVVLVPMRDVRETPRYIRAFYDGLSEEEWISRQKLARTTFEHFLKQDAFFQHFFAKELSQNHV